VSIDKTHPGAKRCTAAGVDLSSFFVVVVVVVVAPNFMALL